MHRTRPDRLGATAPDRPHRGRWHVAQHQRAATRAEPQLQQQRFVHRRHRPVGELHHDALGCHAREGRLQDRRLRLARHRQQTQARYHGFGGTRFQIAAALRQLRGAHRVAAQHPHVAEAGAQLRLQRAVEFQDQQIIGRGAGIAQGLGDRAGAAAEFDDPAAGSRQLRQYGCGQFGARRRDRRGLYRIAQPLAEEGQAVRGGRTRHGGHDAPRRAGKGEVFRKTRRGGLVAPSIPVATLKNRLLLTALRNHAADRFGSLQIRACSDPSPSLSAPVPASPNLQDPATRRR
jgi:hypothetical protein